MVAYLKYYCNSNPSGPELKKKKSACIRNPFFFPNEENQAEEQDAQSGFAVSAADFIAQSPEHPGLVSSLTGFE